MILTDQLLVGSDMVESRTVSRRIDSSFRGGVSAQFYTDYLLSYR